jgi:hypothetical protein
MKDFVLIHRLVGVLLCLSGLAAAPAMATGDKEPNNLCSLPQSVGKLSDASIIGTVPQYDSDFFLVKAQAGAQLEFVAVGQDNGSGYGLLPYPLVGIYDSGCNLIASSGDYYQTAIAKTHFTVPADGKYVVELASCCSLGGGNYQGDYLATVAAYVPPPKISGHVTDINGNPLSYGYATLYHCPSGDYELCTVEYVFSTAVESGAYSLTSESLVVGDAYQVAAQDYYGGPPSRSPVFVLTQADMSFDLRALPQPVAIPEVSWSDGSVPDGGSAQLLTRLTNQTDEVEKIDVWLSISMVGMGSEMPYSRYQQGKPASTKPLTVTLNPRQSKNVSLSFTAPKNALSGTSGEVAVLVSKSGEAFQTYASYGFLSFTIMPEGSVSLASGSSVEFKRRQQQERLHRSLADQPPLPRH